eukprot:CAMPEP_0198509496 /NCGR_PEP_ID=MMETSP1462-20131121/13598_1 /TAXON_ID=1333877 /ORGANISM="Brandtodinium nutriculum, Strain RCC3387" /LENGTH=546 /DNA_ID=CAMNT_0044238805 /DNA_START=1 /DNA_END=1642 /DNA_ORIENTATION=+
MAPAAAGRQDAQLLGLRGGPPDGSGPHEHELCLRDSDRLDPVTEFMGAMRTGSTAKESEQKRMMAIIRQGRKALCRIRWMVGSTWLAISLVIFVVHELSGKYLWREDFTFFSPQSLGGMLKNFLGETLFDLRLLLPSLAPLEDDCFVTRVVLLTDVFVFTYGRGLTLRDLLEGAWAKADHWERTIYCVNLFRGATVSVLALWAVAMRTAPRMQLWMWRAIAYFALTNVIEVLMHSIYDVTVLRWAPNKLGQLPPNFCVLYLLYNRELLRRLQHWLRVRTAVAEATSAAASIACLIGPGDPRNAFEQAKHRFCCMCFADLSQDELQDNTPDPHLHSRTRPVRLGRCDAFISHSWHDNAEAKWAAMQSWRTDFVQTRGREPNVWLDKACIDQNNIDVDLRCLPIFLGGCKRLVIFCGPTYLSRLWCIFEIFSYMMMGGKTANVDLIPVLAEGGEDDEIGDIAAMIDDFDAASCQCFKAEDKEKMLYIVRTAFGSLNAFNQEVILVLHRLQRETRLWSEQTGSSSGSNSSGASESEHSSSSDDAKTSAE